MALTGKVEEVGLDEARRRARLTGLALLASIESESGRLDSVVRVVRLFGMLNAAPDFTEVDFVLDGCSELLNEIFPGRHARTGVVLPSLPQNITLEIEAVFELSSSVEH